MAVDPLFLVTAIEAVLRSGDIQMERFGRDMRVDKKGEIDLVTEVDLAVERMFRDLIAERFPDHQVLAEEMGGAAIAPAGPCWVFDPIDGTTNFAHGLPIFCSSLALEFDGVAEIAAWMRARGRGDGPIALLAGLPVVWHLIYVGAYALHPLGQTPFTIRVRVRSFDQIAKQIHLDRPWVSIDHAMGGNTWFAPPSRTIDWFGLTNVASALERAARLPVANHLLEFLPWVDFAHAEKVLANRAAFLEQFVRVPKTTGRTDDDWMRRALLTEPRWVGPPTRVSFTGGPTLEGVRVRSPEVHAGGALYVEIGLRLAAGDSDPSPSDPRAPDIIDR
jgi:hypothetical protein